jgi:hypothetical protein
MTKTHWSAFANVILLAAMVVSIAQAQTTTAKPATKPTPAPPSAPTSTAAYTLTELQRAHLHEAQLQFFLISRDLQKALDDFNRACEDAKAENKWGSGVRCNMQDLSILPPPAAPEPKK